MRQLKFAREADYDIGDLLARSSERFGAAARRRYAQLMNRAYSDLQTNPRRPGVQVYCQTPEPVFVYHVRHSRNRRDSVGVRHPVISSPSSTTMKSS